MGWKDTDRLPPPVTEHGDAYWDVFLRKPQLDALRIHSLGMASVSILRETPEGVFVRVTGDTRDMLYRLIGLAKGQKLCPSFRIFRHKQQRPWPVSESYDVLGTKGGV